MLAVVGAAAVFALLGHTAVYFAAYHTLARARRRGRWDPTPTPRAMHAFPENAIGVTPGSAYLYAGYSLRPDQALVVEGTVHRDATYASLTLYDLYLQGVRSRTGATHLSDTRLDEAWRVVVAHADHGFERFLDAANQPRGVIVFRQSPADTVVVPRLEVVSLDEAAARYGSTTTFFPRVCLPAR